MVALRKRERRAGTATARRRTIPHELGSDVRFVQAVEAKRAACAVDSDVAQLPCEQLGHGRLPCVGHPAISESSRLQRVWKGGDIG